MFSTHMLNDRGKSAMADYKKAMADAVKIATSMMADCRESHIFLDKMEEAVFFGAKAIALHPTNHESKTEY